MVGGVLHGYDEDWDEGDVYRSVAREHFNATTATIYMGWNGYPSIEAGPNTSGVERIVDWAESDIAGADMAISDMALHGHALLYPISNEDLGWYQELDDGEHAQHVKRYIDDVMAATRGDIEVWDVVNEAFGDPGNAEHPVDAVGLRTDFVEHRSIGDDYIELAFDWAHAADDQAELILNDYGTEEWNTKSTRLFDYVVDLKARGVPIDGVGFQMHLWASRYEPDWQSIRANFARFADAGFDIYITELDVPIIETTNASVVPTAQDLERQRAFYEEVARIAVEQPAVKSLFFWDYADARSWLHPVRNSSMEPFVSAGVYTFPAVFGGGAGRTEPTVKPAYAGLLEGLQSGSEPLPATDRVRRLTSHWEPETSWLTRKGNPVDGSTFEATAAVELVALNDESSQWTSLHWTLVPAGGNYFRLQNSWEPDSAWLTRVGDENEDGPGFTPTRDLTLAGFEPEWSSQLWRLEPVARPDGEPAAWRIVNAWNPTSGVLTRTEQSPGIAGGSIAVVPALAGGQGVQAQHWLLSPLSDFGISGDVNCDGTLTVVDALMVAQYDARFRSPAPCPLGAGSAVINIARADVNQDGTVDGSDTQAIATCLVTGTTACAQG